ncbi:MAG: M20/M25/M40 family metallo-hydrolase [Planctomycetota bacterium]|jgi:hypothetical protein
MKRAIVLIALILALPAFAQDSPPTTQTSSIEEALQLITADGLRAHLEIIAGDEMAGRKAGTEGCRKATKYIADHFEKIGLKPVGDDGTYFQNFDYGRTNKVETRNCVGLLEGSDPELKKEIIVIGAHHDHLGSRKPKDEDDTRDLVWNGADDNGSGTVSVMEIARAFCEGKVRTKRSILFMTFSAEESGLIGSNYYCNNPLFPIEDHVAMLNLDMVGRNPNNPVGISGAGSAAEWKAFIEKAAEKEELKVRIGAGASGGSDHASFLRKKIPAIFAISGLHGDYHRVSDHVDKIEFDRMVKIARTMARVLAAVADLPERPKYTAPPAATRTSRPRLTLGIKGEDIDDKTAEKLGLDERYGGIRLTEITEGSVAEKAGLKVGDIIVRVGTRRLRLGRAMRSLQWGLRRVRENQEVPIEIFRDGEKMTLKAIWEKKKEEKKEKAKKPEAKKEEEEKEDKNEEERKPREY